VELVVAVHKSLQEARLESQGIQGSPFYCPSPRPS
jgi:hypothetical protein